MKNSRYPSPYFRYLKARLWNLTRPGFWGTAIFLFVVGLVIREFWSRPDILTRQSQPVSTQTNSTLSAEDRAVVADIDNLSVLNYDFEQSVQSTLNLAEPISKPKKGNKNPLEEAISKKNTESETRPNSTMAGVTPSSLVKNPFLTQANNLLQFANTENNNGFSGLNSLNQSSSQEDGTESSSSLKIGNRRNSFYGRNYQRNTAINSLEATLNQSANNRNLSITNNGNYINSLQTPSNLSNSNPNSLNPNSLNPNSLNPNSLNPNYPNTFGKQQTNMPSSQGYSQGYSPTYQQVNPSITGGINSIANTTGLPQPTLINQQSNSYGNNDGTINSSYSNFNNNINSNTSLPNTTQSTQLTSPAAIPTQNYNTPYSTVPTAVQSNLPANQNINNDAVKRGLQYFDRSLFPNQVPNQ
jgi:hypothetical protein